MEYLLEVYKGGRHVPNKYISGGSWQVDTVESWSVFTLQIRVVAFYNNFAVLLPFLLKILPKTEFIVRMAYASY